MKQCCPECGAGWGDGFMCGEVARFVQAPDIQVRITSVAITAKDAISYGVVWFQDGDRKVACVDSWEIEPVDE